jgi:eukaryotic-like serine/threonine-protein kinase
VVRQAALALSEAHRIGMVHRDVKPGNLLVRRSDGSIKITDFGIARAADAVPLTQNGMVVGTAQYFSPEQAEGRLVGPASDVYSLGVVAYECLAGRLPFLADSPVAVAMMQIRDAPPPLPPDVPGPVRALVLRTLAKDPRARFASGGELAEAVRAVQEGRWDGASPLPRQPDGIGGTNPGMPAPPPWATPQQGPAAPPTAAPTPTPTPSPSPLPGSAGPSGSSWANPTPAGLLPGGPPTGTHAAPAYGGATAAPGAFGGSAGAGGFGGPEFGPPGATAAGPGGPAGPDSSGPQAFAPPAPGIGRRWRPAPGPPAGYGRRHGPRWPLWVAATVLLALAAAAVVTVLLTERDGSGGSGPDSGTREFAAIAGSHAPIESTDYGRLRAR